MKTNKQLPLHLVSPLLDAICTQYGVARDTVTQPKQKRNGGINVEKARQVACYLLRSYGFKVKEIGSIMGYATHCQSTKNIQLTVRVMSVDKDFAAEIAKIAEQMQQLPAAYHAPQGEAAIAA